jgi:hypothetical protein
VTEKTKPQILFPQPKPDAVALRKHVAAALLDGMQIADATAIASLLQRATEELNPLIERAEKALAGLNLNVQASITLEYDPEEMHGRYLSFRKEGREWGLFVDSGRDGREEDWDYVRLHNASRDARLEALSRLPELEKALVNEASKQCAHALRVVADTAGYLADLEARKP